MSRPTVLERIYTWWSDLHCKGSVNYFTQVDAVTLDLLPASSLDIGLVNPNQIAMFNCSKRSKHCERCSCFKTMRQRFPGGGDWDWDLKVLASTIKGEANGDNSHGKAAQVDNSDVQIRVTPGGALRISGGNHHLEPVHVPVAPSVEDAQDSTNQSDSQRARLENCRVHQSSSLGFSHYQRGHVTNWLIAALLCLVLGSSYLLDGPTDHQARTDTAQSTQDAQRHAQQQARFQRAARKMCSASQGAFELLADGAIQCLTSVGVPTITAKVAL